MSNVYPSVKEKNVEIEKKFESGKTSLSLSLRTHHRPLLLKIVVELELKLKSTEVSEIRVHGSPLTAQAPGSNWFIFCRENPLEESILG